MNPSPAELISQIAALDDGHAITVLRLVLERQGQPVDPIDLRDTQDTSNRLCASPAPASSPTPTRQPPPGLWPAPP